MRFRKQMIVNYVRDFARWMTASPPISSDRFYSHQILPIFFSAAVTTSVYRLASPVENGFIDPFGSAGVTVTTSLTGKRHLRTATPALFFGISSRSFELGVLEYNPSTRPAHDRAEQGFRYYLEELRTLYKFRPHVIVPFHGQNSRSIFRQHQGQTIRRASACSWRRLASAVVSSGL